MKVVCKRNTSILGGSYYLTINKMYEVLIDDSSPTGRYARYDFHSYLIMNDISCVGLYERNLFYNESELRRKKLLKLRYESNVQGKP